MALRDRLSEVLPSWLNDNGPELPSYGFRVLWTLVRFVDSALSGVLQGRLAAVGRGTPTALKYVGAARGVTRGRLDTDESYAAKLPTWIDRWKECGSQRRLAIELAEYLGDSRVRVINRAGHWVTVEADGTITETDAPWDWDSISHPERSDPDNPYWSDEWVVICPTYAVRSGTIGDLTGDDGFGVGHLCPHRDVDEIKRICLNWKGGHSCVRAIIWTSDASRFDPSDSATCPNGRWGAWGIWDSGSFIAGDRDLVSTRYWEPR